MVLQENQKSIPSITVVDEVKQEKRRVAMVEHPAAR